MIKNRKKEQASKVPYQKYLFGIMNALKLSGFFSSFLELILTEQPSGN